MLTDSLNIFTDNKAVRAAGNSEVVSVMPFLGKGNPVTVSVCVTETYPAAATLKITVQDSTDGTTFTDCGVVNAPSEVMKKGGVFSFSLPQTVRGSNVRLAYAVTGTPATGKLWAGVTRDTLEPMEKGQYIDAGKVVL